MNNQVGTKKRKEEIALLDEGRAWKGAPQRVFFCQSLFISVYNEKTIMKINHEKIS